MKLHLHMRQSLNKPNMQHTCTMPCTLNSEVLRLGPRHMSTSRTGSLMLHAAGKEANVCQAVYVQWISGSVADPSPDMARVDGT